MMYFISHIHHRRHVRDDLVRQVCWHWRGDWRRAPWQVDDCLRTPTCIIYLWLYIYTYISERGGSKIERKRVCVREQESMSTCARRLILHIHVCLHVLGGWSNVDTCLHTFKIRFRSWCDLSFRSSFRSGLFVIACNLIWLHGIQYNSMQCNQFKAIQCNSL